MCRTLVFNECKPAVRLIFNLGKYDNISPALEEHHWLPVDKRIKFKSLLLTFKALHGQAPGYLIEMFLIKQVGRYHTCLFTKSEMLYQPG